MPRKAKNRPALAEGQYLFKRTYYYHMKYNDYRTQALIVTDHTNRQQPLIQLEYFFCNEPHHVSPKKHGNVKLSNSRSKFYPTSASTKKLLSSSVNETSSGPTTIFDEVFEKAGGLRGAEADSDLI